MQSTRLDNPSAPGLAVWNQPGQTAPGPRIGRKVAAGAVAAVGAFALWQAVQPGHVHCGGSGVSTGSLAASTVAAPAQVQPTVPPVDDPDGRRWAAQKARYPWLEGALSGPDSLIRHLTPAPDTGGCVR